MYINKKLSVSILILLGIMIILPKSDVFAHENSDVQTLVKGNNAFALDLYAQLKNEEGNLFLSPYSISTALAMTFAGARENTEKQMADVLHFTLEQKRLHSAFSDLETQLKSYKKDGLELNVANALWLQIGVNFFEDFLQLTKTNYDAGFNNVDFRRNLEAARIEINAWVELKTNHKIMELIKPGILTPITVLVLTNAVYFKGNWVSQFEESSTQDTLFYITPETTVDVPMMYQKHEFKYWESDSLQILELPYAGDDLSMFILLSRKIDGLANLENLLSMEKLNQWIKDLKEQQVMVFLPKFKMRSEFRLDSTLVAMGMSDAFKPRADFTGITDPPLWISAVIHEAFIDVDEEGTEATAATAVVMEKSARPTPQPVFRADHPFLFMIRDNHSESILFVGRVVDPSK